TSTRTEAPREASALTPWTISSRTKRDSSSSCMKWRSANWAPSEAARSNTASARAGKRAERSVAASDESAHREESRARPAAEVPLIQSRRFMKARLTGPHRRGKPSGRAPCPIRPAGGPFPMPMRRLALCLAFLTSLLPALGQEAATGKSRIEGQPLAGLRVAVDIGHYQLKQ